MKILTWITLFISVSVFILLMTIGGIFQLVGDFLISAGLKLMEHTEDLDEEY